MNNPNNLFNMMQTGGSTSSAGSVALARALQMQSDRKRLEEQQRKEAKRQKRGGLFGSIGSLAGGLLGAALSPFTGGLSLALAAGLGAGLGRRAGEGLGAGKSKRYDRSGTVFGQQAFRDVEQASRDYTRGMGERALLSGLKTALIAGLTPGGGMYGKVQGKLRKPTGFDVNPAFSMPPSYGAELAGDVNMTASNAEMLKLLNDQVAVTPSSISDTTLMDSLLPDLTSSPQSSNLFNIPKSSFIPTDTSQTSIGSGSSLIGYNQPILENFEDGGFLKLRRGAYIPGDNEGGFGGSMNMKDELIGINTGGSSTSNTGDTNASLPNFGSFTASNILRQSGLDPTSDQLALFQQFDPTQVQQAKTGAQQSLLSMTGGMGLSSLGGGFGARQRAATSAIGRGEDLIGDTIEQEQRAYESQVLGTAADLVAGGADLKKLPSEDDPFYQEYDRPPIEDPNWNPPANSGNGTSYVFNGVTYVFNGTYWMTKDDFEDMMNEQTNQD